MKQIKDNKKQAEIVREAQIKFICIKPYNNKGKRPYEQQHENIKKTDKH